MSRSSSSTQLKGQLPRLCKLPSCGNTFTGHGSKRYCSRSCNIRHLIRKGQIQSQPSEYQRQQRLKRTARNLESAPPCSICGKSTARADYQHNKTEFTDSRTPEGFHLCKSHRRSYSNFIWKNSYEDYDIDEVFTAFLVRMTFTNDNRDYIRMMREAFHQNCLV